MMSILFDDNLMGFLRNYAAKCGSAQALVLLPLLENPSTLDCLVAVDPLRERIAQRRHLVIQFFPHAGIGNRVSAFLRLDQALKRECAMMATETNVMQNLHDIEETAKLVGVSEMTLRRMAKNREISHMRVGTGRGRYKFSDEHIEEYLRSRTFEAGSLAIIRSTL